MQTRVAKVSKDTVDILNEAGALLRSGELVAFPTETVYGLGANAFDADACKRIFEAKGRPSDNPLIVHVSDPSEAENIAYTCPLYYELASKFMPGPLTVILPKKGVIPPEVTAGLDTVAVRCPENEIARALIKSSKIPIAAPSANASGKPSPTSADHVYNDLNGKIPLILDGGACKFGVESTVITIKDGKIIVLRPGSVTPEMLRDVCESVEIAEAVKFVRENAEKFDVDPNKIVVCGFSAGGHLAASLGTLWNNDYLKNILGDTEICKPNGMILSYPVITSGPYCHQGSIDTIIGKEPTNEMKNLVSLEKQVTSDTVKTFIWHCADDGCVPPENTLDYIKQLSANNVSFECHIYPFGGHGLALSDHSTAAYDGHMNATCAKWFDLAVDWVFREI